jgi:hypothetical protein
LTLAQIAEAEAPYVSRREVLRILGKSPDKIEEILREMDADKQSAQELAPPTTNAPDQPQQGEANGNT